MVPSKLQKMFFFYQTGTGGKPSVKILFNDLIANYFTYEINWLVIGYQTFFPYMTFVTNLRDKFQRGTPWVVRGSNSLRRCPPPPFSAIVMNRY